jgi:hypothetical protein
MRSGARFTSLLCFLCFVAALAGAFPGAVAAADGPEVSHYFVPSDLALRTFAGARVVESYGSFALVSSPVPITHHRVSRFEDYGKIYFGREARDPVEEPRAIDFARPPGDAHYLVQFRGPVKEEWRRALDSLGEVAVYVPHHTYAVRLSAEDVAAVQALPQVRWVGHYDASYKIDPRAAALASAAAGSRSTDRLRVIEFPGSEGEVVRGLLSSSGATTLTAYDLLVGRVTVVRLASGMATLVGSLARVEDVQWIEPAEDAVPRNDLAKWVIQSGQSGKTPLHDRGIKGEGQVAGVADDGQDFNHPAFKDPARAVQEIPDPSSPKPPDTAHRKVVNWWDYGGSKSASHGTSTSSIIAGGEVTQHQYDGMAPNAKLSMQAISFSNIDPIAKLFTAAYGDGARTHSDSWGNDNGRYDAWSVGLDDFMWKNDDMQIQIAIANRGPNPNTVSSPESAKNCIATGATNHPKSGAGSEDDVESYSARGPAEDKRLKPDLLAPSRETAADAGSTNYAGAGSGTSFATPSMSGGITLLRQYYADGFYPSGKKNAGDAIVPSAALLKATAINSGKEMNGQGSHTNPYQGMPYPNVDQGWGRLTLDDALYFEGDVRKLVAIEEKTGFKTGDSKEYQVGVEAATEHFEVTLVWTDYPGTAGAGPNLVNDLDLEVTSPSGKVYKGNVFGTATPHQSDEGGTRDSLNNVEAVLRYQPETGVWRLKVTANNVPQGTQQKFALVATGQLAPPTGVALLAPKGGEVLKGNSTFQAQWQSAGAMQANSVDLSYSIDDGATWKSIATGQPLNGSSQWPVPAVDVKTAKVRVSGKDSGGNAKIAESKSFWIDSTPPATKVSASGPVSLQPTVNLSLTMSDAISGVKEADVQYRVGAGGWASAGKTNQTSFAFTATQEGRHDFQSIGEDGAGWIEPAPPSPDATVLVDLKPPTVITTVPKAGEKDVKMDVDVAVTFSEPMARPSVQSATSFEQNKAKIIGFAWANGTQEVMTVQVEGYTSGETYTLVTTSNAKDLAGRPLAGAPFKLTFTMQVETVPPEVIRTSPPAGASEVSTNSSIEIEFSEAMKQAQTQAAVTITPKPVGNYSWSGNVLKFSPAKPGLKRATTYKVAVGTAAQDRAGNALQQTYEFSFSTEGSGIPGLPPLFTGGLLGLGLVGDLILLIVLLIVVVAAIATVRKRRRRAPAGPFYGASEGYVGTGQPPTLAPAQYGQPQGSPPGYGPGGYPAGGPPVQPP